MKKQNISKWKQNVIRLMASGVCLFCMNIALTSTGKCVFGFIYEEKRPEWLERWGKNN